MQENPLNDFVYKTEHGIWASEDFYSMSEANKKLIQPETHHCTGGCGRCRNPQAADRRATGHSLGFSRYPNKASIQVKQFFVFAAEWVEPRFICKLVLFYKLRPRPILLKNRFMWGKNPSFKIAALSLDSGLVLFSKLQFGNSIHP